MWSVKLLAATSTYGATNPRLAEQDATDGQCRRVLRCSFGQFVLPGCPSSNWLLDNACPSANGLLWQEVGLLPGNSGYHFRGVAGTCTDIGAGWSLVGSTAGCRGACGSGTDTGVALNLAMMPEAMQNIISDDSCPVLTRVSDQPHLCTAGGPDAQVEAYRHQLHHWRELAQLSSMSGISHVVSPVTSSTGRLADWQAGGAETEADM